ncbi:PepSY-associated TM helix domain-containing protein [Rhodocyclus tenuis]|uniref:Putative iron-regulated membrane protein n=1 Tax=Rhodocyclus tenuis TaxID=1066 RepID=A0A840G7Y4_RHOTE|nr:PepSY-associated TM helix domain-containing protein [Rhodocyclus tenuis]MBB4247995.1 putative iron-regulated membrane protein [Rhodocyclus tenuis]
MRTEFIRIYKSVHTWTGILSGLALFIAFYAGALTVFKEEIVRWAAPPAAIAATDLAQAHELIARTLAEHPEAARDFKLHLQPAEHLPAPMSWSIKPPDADEHDSLAGRHYLATLDAAGLPAVSETQPSQLGELIDILHRVVGLPFDNDPNRWLMGVIAVLYALALISGVIVLLPSLVKDLFALRVGKNLKRMWLDAHNVVGFISLPFHVVFALTAAVFAFHDGLYALQDHLLYDGRIKEMLRPVGGAKPQARSFDPATMLPPAELVARVQAVVPDFVPDTLQYLQATGPRPVVRVWGHDPQAISPRAPGGFAVVDPYGGRLLSTDYLPGKQDAASTTVSSFFALHFATFGGTPVRWMYFLLGLAGAWLFYSGNLLWIESRRRKQRAENAAPEQRRDFRLLGALTIGTCLGCISGISFAIVAAKGLHGRVDDLNAWLWYVYYACFFAAIGWAFNRGAARAAVDLLWLSAGATLAIPLSSLLALLWPALGLWVNLSTASLGVDVTALLGSLALAWMARETARRARIGPQDSVWSDTQMRNRDTVS